MTMGVNDAAAVRTRADIASLLATRLPTRSFDTDVARCRILSADIAIPAPAIAAAVVRPADHAAVVALTELAHANAIALHPRGGGFSYTGGFLPQKARAVLVDLSGIDGVAIAPDRNSVTVGAGATWATLYDAFVPHGVRVPSFGPLSGYGATVGGLAAQDGGFFGAARYGLVGESTIIGVRMVDGNAVTHDLTRNDRVGGARAPQPLAGDCGAFGIKTSVTLALMPTPAQTAFASAAFDTADQAISALAALSGHPAIGEAFVFDPGTHANLAATGFSLREAGAIAGDLLKAGENWTTRIGSLVRAAQGRGAAFMRELQWSLHVALEGTHDEVTAGLSDVARVVGSHGGLPLPDTIPRVTRARPFRPVKALLGPAGELWLPLHGVVAATDGAATVAAVNRSIEAMRPAAARLGVRTVMLSSLVGRDRMIVEPQIFWPDALPDYHKHMVLPQQAAKFAQLGARHDARALAYQLRSKLIDVLNDCGAMHFQVGRTYAAHPGVAPETLLQWRSLKSRFDPANIMNPGVLGV